MVNYKMSWIRCVILGMLNAVEVSFRPHFLCPICFAVYSASNLLVLLNDDILRKALSKTLPVVISCGCSYSVSSHYLSVLLHFILSELFPASQSAYISHWQKAVGLCVVGIVTRIKLFGDNLNWESWKGTVCPQLKKQNSEKINQAKTLTTFCPA